MTKFLGSHNMTPVFYPMYAPIIYIKSYTMVSKTPVFPKKFQYFYILFTMLIFIINQVECFMKKQQKEASAGTFSLKSYIKQGSLAADDGSFGALDFLNTFFCQLFYRIQAISCTMPSPMRLPGSATRRNSLRSTAITGKKP